MSYAIPGIATTPGKLYLVTTRVWPTFFQKTKLSSEQTKKLYDFMDRLNKYIPGFDNQAVAVLKRGRFASVKAQDNINMLIGKLPNDPQSISDLVTRMLHPSNTNVLLNFTKSGKMDETIGYLKKHYEIEEIKV